MDLSKKIKNSIESTGMSLCEFSKKTGISKSYLSNLKNGNCNNLSISKLELIAFHSSIPIEYFLKNDSETFTNKQVMWEKFKRLSCVDQAKFMDIIDLWVNKHYLKVCDE